MKKVMVIDDDEDFTNLYKAALRAAGFDASGVNQSASALELAYLSRPDVFVIDLMMPDIDGFQLCRMIRADPVLKDIPIIIVTALTDLDSRLIAMGAGANDYLTKPFHVNELKQRINILLSESN
ncbi:MAG: response regulator transcription factor [Chloroflexota bacterium]|nr:response regulator transcription factor [Chloroflexota bacterium]MBI5702785.1 response regulator transcription factor [Chloroflexota bacterium]